MWIKIGKIWFSSICLVLLFSNVKTIQADLFASGDVTQCRIEFTNTVSYRNLPLNNKYPIDFEKVLSDPTFNSIITHLYILRKNTVGALNVVIWWTRDILHLLEVELGIEPDDTITDKP